AALLQQAVASGIEPEYVQKLLDAFPVRQNPHTAVAPSSGAHSVPSCLVEPLSKRELEVLQWMAKGLSNREIAECLVLAGGTVKVHVHNICGKLGVRNRTQAILRAQQLGLLT
ncbi:MAG: helix-turn-helix domain-containing protein, partial [Omnitrophica WOR_2 bacterium]